MEGTIQIELSIEKVTELIKQGHLCAGQIRCLTPESKQVIWRLCLETCGNTTCYEAVNQTRHPQNHEAIDNSPRKSSATIFGTSTLAKP
ncbi:hypothetical protein VIAG107301_15555 [Vibrio agarivorans]